MACSSASLDRKEVSRANSKPARSAVAFAPLAKSCIDSAVAQALELEAMSRHPDAKCRGG